MKKLLLLLALVPFVAFARHHKPVPVPPPVPPPTATSTLCVNIGHDSPSLSVFTQQLAILKAKGVSCIRINYIDWNSPTTEAYATAAKGFRVILGGDWWKNGSGTVHASDLPAYTAAVLTQAKWAQTNGIAQMSLGNEKESSLTDMSVCQWYSYLQGLSQQVKTVYSGTISYEMNSEYLSQYASCGGANSLLMGVNLYGGTQYNETTLQQAITKFGTAYVSESNCDMQYVSACSTDAGHAAEVAGDFLKMHADFPTVPLYYFAFGANGSNGVASNWGLYSGTVLQEPLTAKALNL